jgi:opacity protein-like surface antigen
VKENLVEDYFNYATFKSVYEPFNMEFSVSYRNVGQGYRSAGAQMRRLKYKTEAFMFDRYTNQQVVRPVGMWDIKNDPTFYNSQIEVGLAEFYPQYNNIDPYGLATPNRQGLDFVLTRVDEDDRYSVSLEYGMLSEIVGLGVEDLKKFNSIAANLDMNIENMLPNYDKQITMQFGYTNDQTKRTGDQAFISTELNTQRIYAGLTLELTDKLFYLLGYETIEASGKDYLAIRDRSDVVDDFTLFETELSEQILGIGLRYEFDSKNDLQILWQDYSWSNSVLETADYGFDRLSVIYLMKF